MSRHTVAGGDIAGLLARFGERREKVKAPTSKRYPLMAIQEAGLDGFWIDRRLRQEDWIESHVVHAASIAVSRRRRRAKTDRIDGETMVRALLAHRRGDPRVCSMVRGADPRGRGSARRICRERKALIGERTLHINRVKGLLFSQGITGFEPLRRDRRKRLEKLSTGASGGHAGSPLAAQEITARRCSIGTQSMRAQRSSSDERLSRPLTPNPKVS